MRRELIVASMGMIALLCASHAAAQSGMPISAKDAQTAVRYVVRACEALRDKNPQAKKCVTECTRILDGIPTSKPSTYPMLVKSCNGQLEILRQTEASMAESGRAATPVAAAPAGTNASPPANPKPSATTASLPKPASNTKLTMVRELGFVPGNPAVDDVFQGIHDGGNTQEFRLVFNNYVAASERICKKNTPNGTRTYEVVTQQVVKRNGGVVRKDLPSSTTWEVDAALIDTFVSYRNSYPSDMEMTPGGILAATFGPVGEGVEIGRTTYADFERLFKESGCNNPPVKQMNENLRRAARKLPSLQDDLDATLPMPYAVQVRCDAYQASAKADNFGYRLTSCSCLAKHIGKKLMRADKIAMSKHVDSGQVALIAYKFKVPALARECLTPETRVGGVLPVPNPEPAVNRYAGTPYGSPECQAAIHEARFRNLSNACSIDREQARRISEEVTRVLKGPLCQSAGGHPIVAVEYDAERRCAVQTEGSANEEEAWLAERMTLAGSCAPVSDPDTQRRVQGIMSDMGRREVQKRLEKIGPMINAEGGPMTTAKACTAIYLLGQWRKT